MLAAFATQMDAGSAGVEHDISDLDRGDLRDASPGVVEHQEQHMVPLANPGSVRRADYRQHLIAGQVAEHRSLEALHRNPEGALDHL